MTNLTGKVAVVTGTGSGIGRATALRLAADGATVFSVSQRPDGARQTAEAVEEIGGIADHHAADLADPVERAGVIAAALERFGRVDVLVNNAAYHGKRIPFLDLTDDDLDQVVTVNLTATTVLCREAARDMVTRGTGAIVNITAIQERMPLPTYAAYGASKGGVSALTRTLATELSPLGIRVNAVAPGMIVTASLDQAIADIGRASTPPASLLGRHGTAEELASAVAFLASEEASFITGVVLTVDGGRRLSRRPDPMTGSDESAADTTRGTEG